MASQTIDEEDLTYKSCVPIPYLLDPVDADELPIETSSPFMAAFPSFGPLIVENESSDARDHCANERTFLSNLRLAVYMAIVSVAIIVSFHINHQPSDLEVRLSRPLGAIFWVLSMVTLGMGVANYIKTVNQYTQRTAIVQTGRKTQAILGILAVCIIVTCAVLVAIDSV